GRPRGVAGKKPPRRVVHVAHYPRHGRPIHVDVQGREKDRDARRRPHPAVLDLRDHHHLAVGGGEHRARKGRRPAVGIAKEAEERQRDERERERPHPPPHHRQNTRGGGGREDEGPALGGRRDTHGPSVPAYSRGGLIQDIILRRRAPTSSI